MPGVNRPYTLEDVLAVAVGTVDTSVDTSDTPTGQFAETSESVTTADSWSHVLSTNPVWDAGVWGGFAWS